MDCLSSKVRVLNILHEWGVFYVFDMVFESCLKMLVTWIDCHGRIECVTYISCMRGCIPAYVSVSHMCVCVSEEWRNSLMSAPGDIQVTCIVYYCFSLGCF